MFPENAKELRRNEIRSALLQNLSAKDSSKQSHRKSHGAMRFLEMNKIMCDSWKSIHDFTRFVFEEFAEEGRGMYLKRIAEYDEKYPSSHKKKKIKLSNSIVMPKKSQPKVHADRTSPPKYVALDAPKAMEKNSLKLYRILTFSSLEMKSVVLLPMFPDIFDFEETSHVDTIPIDCVADISDICSVGVQPSSEYMLEDFAHLPFSPVEEEKEPKMWFTNCCCTAFQ
mmetsp:Transcript_23963/g.42890  ORF Transcript_23963/g.42890 Transcript_23963/m.42890 type:complete len:226 (-) Transcript_23963:215-892(-)